MRVPKRQEKFAQSFHDSDLPRLTPLDDRESRCKHRAEPTSLQLIHVPRVRRLQSVRFFYDPRSERPLGQERSATKKVTVGPSKRGGAPPKPTDLSFTVIGSVRH